MSKNVTISLPKSAKAEFKNVAYVSFERNFIVISMFDLSKEYFKTSTVERISITEVEDLK